MLVWISQVATCTCTCVYMYIIDIPGYMYVMKHAIDFLSIHPKFYVLALTVINGILPLISAFFLTVDGNGHTGESESIGGGGECYGRGASDSPLPNSNDKTATTGGLESSSGSMEDERTSLKG